MSGQLLRPRTRPRPIRLSFAPKVNKSEKAHLADGTDATMTTPSSTPDRRVSLLLPTTLSLISGSAIQGLVYT
jgi:hypothetical protein